MKIAQLTYSYKPIIGGADAYADLLCSTFRERGHEVWVYQRAAKVDDPFVRTAPGWQALFRPRDFWLVPLWLRGLWRELTPMDVLVAHYPNYCSPGVFDAPLVGLSHGVTWDDAPGSWRGRRKHRMALQAFNQCARFVANDTFFLREMGLDINPGERPFEEVAPGRWFIPNCVDTSVFRPPGAPDERRPLITVPRNLYRNRGVDLAVRAFAIAADELPEWRMEVVGAEGQPDYAAEVRGLVKDLGLSDRVRFGGSVPWAQMPRVYRRARVCLVPSLCGEGTSLAALEAMACRTATITTNIGGLPDLPAVQCPPAVEALAAAITDVLPRWDEVAATQQRAVLQGFTIDRWQRAWAGVIEDW